MSLLYLSTSQSTDIHKLSAGNKKQEETVAVELGRKHWQVVQQSVLLAKRLSCQRFWCQIIEYG